MVIAFLDKSRLLEFRIRPFAPALLLSKKTRLAGEYNIYMQVKIIEKFKKLKPIHYLVIFLGIIIYFGAIIGIVNYQSNKQKEPPVLEVTAPKDGEIYSTKDVLVEGTTDSGAEISINSIVADVDKNGAFSTVLPLNLGANSISVVSTKGSLTTEKNISVSRINPEPQVKKKPTQKKTVAFSAKLNNSGPETLWVFEIGSFSAAAVAWQMSRNKLKMVQKK
jgi:hypothetical protein